MLPKSLFYSDIQTCFHFWPIFWLVAVSKEGEEEVGEDVEEEVQPGGAAEGPGGG